ncbi:hypothetical protein GCM10007940_16980 [Portibacter lacus]|uniref:Alpha-L-fucosidase 2 n=2 Tax=Portibacter lacus TaxID=1099794 RepID=A0AA37WDM5_9BACT|nr:hypothetical protein GCM10007940_16980 [Portibacter lacus]
MIKVLGNNANKKFMKKFKGMKLGFVLFFIIVFNFAGLGQQEASLNYDTAAKVWTEALPVGNGRLGGMIYGGVAQEHIQFNEETLWAGEPHDYAHQGAKNYLGEIRQLLTDGNSKAAHKLAQDHFMSEPLKQLPYQPFGDLYLNFENHEEFTNYRRSLDLSSAISKVSYTAKGVNFTRDVFVSHPDQVMVVRLEADKKGSLSFEVNMDAEHEEKKLTSNDNQQSLEIAVKDGALHGAARLKVETDGSLTEKDGVLSIANASSATIYLTAATNYINFRDVSGNPAELVEDYLAEIEGESYEQIKTNHLEDYQELYNRFSVDFGDNGQSAKTTDQRIYDFWKNPDDPELLALYIQFARYLTISTSRPGTNPSNLQGIWNDKMVPPWLSGYTTNINLEMNYWPVEITNLSECHEPLFKFISELSESGSVVAKEHYDADGWVAHHNVDLWRGAAPVNASHHGIWVTGGAWLSTHIWEHYLFTMDEQFLKDRYPLMRDAAIFFTDFLYKDPNTGYLISSPSNSPEIGGLVAGPTMDHQIIRALFRNTIEAAKVLGEDEELVMKLNALIPEIAPNQIGQHGQLQEWLEDKDDPDVHHRHVSHLWAVYPGNEINLFDTPDLMKAAKQSLEFRGDNGTGWSLAWKVNFWARFRDGNHAYKILHGLLSPAEEPLRKNKGGSYPNLFDAHPPFQIDGNFGGTSGILEMLVQSHLEGIELLPALPDALPEGEVSGLCARGGFELSFKWKDGILENLEVLSKKGGTCRLAYGDNITIIETKKGETYQFNGSLKEMK